MVSFEMNSCTASARLYAHKDTSWCVSSLISWFGSRSDEENTLIFPGQTSPLSSRLIFPTVCLPSSWGVSKVPKAQRVQKSPWSFFQDSLPQSVASLSAQLCKPENWSRNVISLRAGTRPILFSAVSSRPRTVHGTERVLIMSCGMTVCNLWFAFIFLHLHHYCSVRPP